MSGRPGALWRVEPRPLCRRERERERERTSPGGCVETLGRAATPNSQAPPCGLRWHNHLAEIREPCPRAACYKRLLDARPGYNAMDQLAKSELTL